MRLHVCQLLRVAERGKNHTTSAGEESVQDLIIIIIIIPKNVSQEH